ncbi:MAG: helix-turn-helix transcriptional regulator [Butyricicoccus pullicaecorum]|nr:helix-turn-helix transcriptional regulator [Butyricicoccus pullicaecorum]
MIYKIIAVAIIIIYLIIITFIVYLAYLIIKALRKYINSKDVREQKVVVRLSLAELLKENRTRCRMTQEFVAEAIGVSRQAVSKWENGSADPSTSNLIALANLYEISAEDLLKNIVQKNNSNNFSDKDKEYKN